MNPRLLLASACVFAASALFAQSSDIHHHNFSAGAGPAIPAGSTTGYLSTAPLVRVSYGYRFNRLFQADAGFQLAFGAADNRRNAAVTDAGTVQGGDREYMIPLGGRIYIPLPFKRVEVSAGAGPVYLHYSETANAGGYAGYYGGVTCYSCTSRGGWGGYGLANANYFLDDSQTFHVGATLQYIVGRTSGAAVGNVPAVRTTDRWANLTFEFGVSF